MNLDDIKESLLNILNRIWERIQETALYIQAKERFDGLAPQAQKATALGFFAFVYFLMLLLPYSWYQDSTVHVEAFEKRREVIRELLKVSREVTEVPNIPVPPPVETIKSDASSRAKEVNLIDDQIKSVELTSEPTQLVPQDKAAGSVKVEVSQLNLRQVVDLGTKLSRLNLSVKMTDLLIKARTENPHYFDVTYKLTALAIPDFAQPEAAE